MKGRNWVTVAIAIPVATVILLVTVVLPLAFAVYFLGSLILTLGLLTGEGARAMPFVIPVLILTTFCYCRENAR